MPSPVDTQELSNSSTESSSSTQTATEPFPQHSPKILSGSLVIYPHEDNKPAS
ncbi:hypothetical protein [Chlamydia caviae]|uniref:hypothetical protein n=1 Tax=Chlamydia caviae TaxID=83557 RepID=UPI0002E2802C|nr:hypothetical protein [Chlamydia caviae]